MQKQKILKDSEGSEESLWLSVIGRALAYQCLNSAEIQEKNMGDRAAFLTALGLPRKNVAAMLDTTVESIGVQMTKRSKNKKKKAKNAKNKK